MSSCAGVRTASDGLPAAGRGRDRTRHGFRAVPGAWTPGVVRPACRIGAGPALRNAMGRFGPASPGTPGEAVFLSSRVNLAGRAGYRPSRAARSAASFSSACLMAAVYLSTHSAPNSSVNHFVMWSRAGKNVALSSAVGT